MAADKSPIGWAITPLKRYAEFSGRSSRAEFWWYTLFTIIFFMVIWFALVGSMAGLMSAGTEPGAGAFGALGGGMILIGLLYLAILLPTIAVQIRRLHDTNRSGWWIGGYYLLYAVYLVMLFGSMSAAMGAAMAGDGTPPAPNTGMMMGTGILAIVMFIYMIVLLVFFCLPGTKGDNRFGPDPYGADVEKVFA